MAVTWSVFSFAEDRSRKVKDGMIAITKEISKFRKFVLLSFNSSIPALAYSGRSLWSVELIMV